MDPCRSVLATEDRRFAALAETAVDAIVSADHHGRITDWNPAAQSMFGYRRDEVLGQSLEMLMPARFRAAHRTGLERMAGGTSGRTLGTTVELHAVHRAGHEFPIELSLSSWCLDGAMYFTGVIRDISDRRRAEREAARYAEQLEARNRALTDEQAKLVSSQAALTDTVLQLEQTFSLLADLLTGHQLAGRYRLEFKLHSDGGGALYEALDVEQDMAVYVRVLRCTRAARSLDAQALMAALDLPSAPEVLDAGVADVGLPFVVLELLSGESLADRLARRRPIAVHEAVAWCAVGADALASAHARDMVHGWLTPRALFFRDADTPEEALLMVNFEVAGLERAGHCMRPLAARDLGRYCAPEIRGNARPSAPSDVYGLATVLLVALVGDVRDEDADWALAECAPDWLALLIRACRAPDPAQRPSARQFAERLRAGAPGAV